MRTKIDMNTPLIKVYNQMDELNDLGYECHIEAVGNGEIYLIIDDSDDEAKDLNTQTKLSEVC